MKPLLLIIAMLLIFALAFTWVERNAQVKRLAAERAALEQAKTDYMTMIMEVSK